jgi:hypothetical protein
VPNDSCVGLLLCAIFTLEPIKPRVVTAVAVATTSAKRLPGNRLACRELNNISYAAGKTMAQ